MFTRIAQLALVGWLALASVTAVAQDEEMQEMRAQMQQIGMQVMQKMAEQNIDPQEFFGNIREQMQNGTLDMAALQDKLVEKGLIDKETVTKMQTTAQNATMGSIQRQLGVNDAEWKVLVPMIQRVIASSAYNDGMGQMGRVMMFMRAQMPKSDVAKKKQELQVAISNPTATPDEIKLKLAALREANQKAKAELTTAQNELVGVLTARQEAVLVTMGLL